MRRAASVATILVQVSLVVDAAILASSERDQDSCPSPSVPWAPIGMAKLFEM